LAGIDIDEVILVLLVLRPIFFTIVLHLCLHADRAAASGLSMF
jgi:hypothetical protein